MATRNQEEPKYITEIVLARMLGLSPQTIRRWRHEEIQGLPL